MDRFEPNIPTLDSLGSSSWGMGVMLVRLLRDVLAGLQSVSDSDLSGASGSRVLRRVILGSPG
jgi:hypothetical protein